MLFSDILLCLNKEISWLWHGVKFFMALYIADWDLAQTSFDPYGVCLITFLSRNHYLCSLCRCENSYRTNWKEYIFLLKLRRSTFFAWKLAFTLILEHHRKFEQSNCVGISLFYQCNSEFKVFTKPIYYLKDAHVYKM